MRKHKPYNRRLKLEQCDTMEEVVEETNKLLSYAMTKLINIKIAKMKEEPVYTTLAYRKSLFQILFTILSRMPSYAYRSIHNLSRQVEQVLLDIEPANGIQRKKIKKNLRSLKRASRGG